MPSQGWVASLFDENAGSAITAAAEAKLTSDFVFPASWFMPGVTIRLTGVFKASNVVTTPGTIQFRVRWGGLTGTVLVDSGALTQSTSAQTDKTGFFEIFIKCLTAGATGTFLTYGTMVRGNAVSASPVPDILPPASLAAVTVDTTAATALSVTVQPSLGTASITRMEYHIESLN